ncbi:MAG: formylmethanofuran dehydrogenase subunit E family protein [Armatimonadota bacterium]
MMREFTNLDLAKSYHGHLGPFLVIGIKMGNRAINELQPEDCFQLHADVYCPECPPPSCIIDGIQLSTGCTMGKRNISHIISPDEVRTVITNKASGRRMEMKLNSEFVQNVTCLLRNVGEEEASMFCWNAADDEVFATLDSTVQDDAPVS